MESLLAFYGTECPHCVRMEPLITKLEKEHNLKVSRMEVWHNEENAKKMNSLDKGYCGGVPFFFNSKNGKWLCGEAPYEDLVEWARAS